MGGKCLRFICLGFVLNSASATFSCYGRAVLRYMGSAVLVFSSYLPEVVD
jgi:hypothetical protein